MIEKIKEKYLILALFLFDFGLKIFRLWDPAFAYFDEKAFYVPAARGYLQGNPNLNLEHPPLAKLFIALSIKIFGDNPLGWRFFGVVLGSLGVVFTYLLAKEITKNKKISLVAALALSFEFGWFSLSRVGTIDIYLASFALFGCYFAFKFFQKQSLASFFLTSIFLGAAFCVKWSALLIIVWIFLFWFLFIKRSLRFKVATFLCSGLIISAVYLLSYLPFLLQHNFQSLVELHRWMLSFHENYVPALTKKALDASGSTFSPFPAWSWILDPVFPFFGEMTSGMTKTVLFFYNPLLLWGGFVSLLYLIWQQRKKIDPKIIFILGSVFFLWAPWLASPRYSLHYYLLPAIPFFCIAFALGLRQIHRRNSTLALTFLVGVVAVFFIYYPLISGLEVSSIYSRLISGIVEFRRVSLN